MTPGMETTHDSPVLQPSQARGFCGCDALAVYEPVDVIALVVGLLDSIHPSTVVRFVMAVWIDAVDLIVSWARPHVIKEVLKRLKPSFADGDTSAAIVRKHPAFWSKAAVLHRSPCVELAARLVASRVTVSQKPLSLKTPSDTPAAPAASCQSQVISRADRSSAAVASALPLMVLRAVWVFFVACELHNNKAPKSLPHHIRQWSLRRLVLRILQGPTLSKSSCDGHWMHWHFLIISRCTT